MRKVLAAGWIVATSIATAAPALANSATAQFNVSVTVIKQCTVVGPAAINFGVVGGPDLVSGSLAASQPFSVTCSNGVPYTIGFLGVNDNPVGSSTHVMKGAVTNTDSVSYQLFDTTSNAANQAALNNSTSVITGTGNGLAQTRTLQGKIVGQTVAPSADVYMDTVTLSVSY